MLKLISSKGLKMPLIREDSDMWQIKWHWIFAWSAAGTLLFGLIAWICILFNSAALVQFFGGVFGFLLLLTVFFAGAGILTMTVDNIRSIRDNNEQIRSLSELIKRQQIVLEQINQGVRLSDTAKAIGFRDADRVGLRDAVLAKLHSQDFETTYKMIDDISRRPEYAELAKNLKQEADSYKDANQQERIEKVISYVHGLMDNYQWVKAAEQIERLKAAYPDSETVKNLSPMLKEKKNLHKRELLAGWDEAVKRRETDRSLAILKELDLYLTPSEALALQESARDVFRSKLHNLGVQFSLEITEKQWQSAIDTGKQIIKDFPNSRMAQEIREKMAALKDLAASEKSAQ